MKSWLIWKDPDAGRDWGQEEKETTEDEMVRWHHRLNGHGFGWTLGVGDGQEGLVCCSSWGHKELDMTERLNWTEIETSIQRSILCWNATEHTSNLLPLEWPSDGWWCLKVPFCLLSCSSPKELNENCCTDLALALSEANNKDTSLPLHLLPEKQP